jgi:hypothetical protein
MRFALFTGVAAFLLLISMIVHASILSYIWDVISTSAPATEATHTIKFTATSDIPPSGHILISFDDAAFSIPPTLDYTDVDLSLSSDSGNTFIDRDLSPTADATNDGVTVLSNGTFDIQLNSTTGITAGDIVQVLIGTNATVGDIGTDNITNPTDPGSYRITFETTDDTGNAIDHGATMIAVVLPVSLHGAIPLVAPTRSNGLPSGLIAANNVNIELSLQTDILAHCRYATSSGVLYSDMTGDFSTFAATTHWVNTTGYQNNTTYTFYVRCAATNSGFANDDDFPISFTLKPTPPNNTSATTTGNISQNPLGNLGNGGAGDFPSGSNVLYLSSVTFTGVTIPNANVTELKDGTKVGSVQAKSDGTFSAQITGLERGAYGFQLYAQDSKGLTTSLYSTALSIGQGTDNSITGIVLPPTIQLSTDTANPGDTITASGSAPPNAILSISLATQTGSTTSKSLKSYTASSSATGDWSFAIDTASLKKSVYSVQSTAAVSTTSISGISKNVTFALGTSAKPGSCGNPDMNGDGKVNLVDFSIFLLSWGTDAPAADYNCDGTVNLADFSIMLFQWTG